MGTPENVPASLDSLFKTALVLDNSPHITEEMAEQFFAQAGVLPLIENKYVFADFQKQLKKLQASGGIRKQYDIGKNVEEFKEALRHNKAEATRKVQVPNAQP